MISMGVPQNEIIEALHIHDYSEPEIMDSHENVMKVKFVNKTSDSSEMNGSVGSYYNAENSEVRIARCISITSISVYERLMKAEIRGVPHIFEVISCDGFGLVIEEYVQGRDLNRLIEDGSGYLRNISNIDLIISGIVDILESLGNMNPPIIHRDIKPANIMMDDKKNIYLIDFNISREHDGSKVHDTVAMGTRGFAAPEQYGFSESDIRTDFYGLGATIKYILDNISHYQTFLPDEEREAIFRVFADKCMMLDKKDRFQNVAEIRAFLGYANMMNIGYKVRKQEENRNIKYKKDARNNSYMIPGFRTKNPVNMIIAVLGYITSAYLSYQLMFNDYNGFEGLSRDRRKGLNVFTTVFTFFIMIIVIFFVTDYRNMQSKFAFLRKAKTRSEHALRVGLVAIIFFLLLIFLEGLILVSAAEVLVQ